MSLYKSSQIMDAKDDFKDFGNEDEVVIYEDKPSEDEVIEMHQPEEIEISFKLPPLPGSDAGIPIEVSTDDDIEAKEDDKNDLELNTIEVKDPSDWRSYEPKRYQEWAKFIFNNIPKHSGKETTGIERVVSYLKRFDGDISRAISNDFKGDADISKLEEVRKEIYEGVSRLEDAKDKLEEIHYRKKKASSEIVKEAKQTHIGGIIITVPLHISTIARACINSMVSAGKDMHKSVDYFIKKFELSARDQMELFQLLSDMGFYIKAPRGLLDTEEYATDSEDNIDFGANFPA